MALYFIYSTCGGDSQSGTIETERPVTTHKGYNELVKDYEKKIDKHPEHQVCIVSFNRLD